MKMIFAKKTTGLEPGPKDPGAPRTRKKRGAALRTRDFWRALSNAALSSQQTPMLRRFHD
jgi:hypothetical protein